MKLSGRSSVKRSHNVAGKYGFTNRVIDGISLTITNLTFTVKLSKFDISIFLPSIDIYSTTPFGKKPDSLKSTRLRNLAKDHIILFKEIAWSSTRIEAASNDSSTTAAAIRLIGSSCRMRIIMKKNLNDSSLVASRVQLHFDDLLWVVNDAQLKSAMNTYLEITNLMKKASDQRKKKAQDKLIKQEQSRTAFQPQKPTTGDNNQQSSANSTPNISDAFERYDVLETSLHLSVKRLDLHIVADSDVLSDRLAEGGALQLTIANLTFDHYPYHQFGSSKKHWSKYSELQSDSRNDWAGSLYKEWQDQINKAKTKVVKDDMSVKLESALQANRICLFESCSVINIDDLVLYQVSLINDKSEKHGKDQRRRRACITSDRSHYQLPEFLGIVNIQFAEYYYPDPYAFPVPNSDLYIQLLPVRFVIDFATLSWINAFMMTMSTTMEKTILAEPSEPEHVDIMIDAMLPRIVVTSDIFSPSSTTSTTTKLNSSDLKSSSLVRNESTQFNTLELTFSKLLLTNTRIDQMSSTSMLEKHLNLFNKKETSGTSFFDQMNWPLSSDPTVKSRISPLFKQTSEQSYLYKNPLNSDQKLKQVKEPKSSTTALHSYYTMTTDSLKKSSKYDIWHFTGEKIWCDFNLSRSIAKQSMIDSLTISGWMVLDQNNKDDESKSDDSLLNILCVIEGNSMIKITQKQYTFVMNLINEIGLFLDVLDQTKLQSDLIERKTSGKRSKETKITLCLTTPSQLTLAVLESLEELGEESSSVQISILGESNGIVSDSGQTTTVSNLDINTEPNATLQDSSDANLVVDLVTTPAAILAGTVKLEAPVQPSLPSPSISVISLSNESTASSTATNNLTKGFSLLGQKRSKIEETVQKGLDTLKVRAPSQSSLFNSGSAGSDSDETSSQWDLSDDLDADLESNFGDDNMKNGDLQQKGARIDIDDDLNSLKGVSAHSGFDLVNGTFVKLDRIDLCITEEISSKQFYVGCNINDIHVDEFIGLKFENIKPKLFDNNIPCNTVNSPIINVPVYARIDFPKGSEPPHVRIEVKDRRLQISKHSIDILSDTLEEIKPMHDKIEERQHSNMVTIDVLLTNMSLLLETISPTLGSIISPKPPLDIQIEQLHVRRLKNGQVVMEKQTDNGLQLNDKPQSKQCAVVDDQKLDEKLKHYDLVERENDRLHVELDAHKQQIIALRQERDSLIANISKLDVELTKSEFVRVQQQEQHQHK
ncbi:unnamed protein product [Didymodactylos carnosus]|uniref:UHRF1-binding protein 1-like n=1 Tax=Didymodactylos carnosus TaxID=1234261 RepID=A0A814Y4K0_9BILA|nr:unnamed protein product [Didymodactylos carnosus]CAF1225171.1 unnamed protein product [Didymodactylos carnosus]CAF3791218.1 unnamed protein product [Didymodactylos carnosus]CAF3988153.1 unnamed protein product [Didymodactylos carnosus]